MATYDYLIMSGNVPTHHDGWKRTTISWQVATYNYLMMNGNFHYEWQRTTTSWRVAMYHHLITSGNVPPPNDEWQRTSTSWWVATYYHLMTSGNLSIPLFPSCHISYPAGVLLSLIKTQWLGGPSRRNTIQKLILRLVERKVNPF